MLAADGNEIIFWYTKDTEHAPVQIIHWVQNIVGDGYTEYQSSTNLNGIIGKTYTEQPLTLDGFTYKADKSTSSCEECQDLLLCRKYGHDSLQSGHL